MPVRVRWGRLILGSYLVCVGSVLALGGGGASVRELLDFGLELPVPELVGGIVAVAGAVAVAWFLRSVDAGGSLVRPVVREGAAGATSGSPSKVVSRESGRAPGRSRGGPGSGSVAGSRQVRGPGFISEGSEGSESRPEGGAPPPGARGVGGPGAAVAPAVGRPGAQVETGAEPEQVPELGAMELIRCWERYRAEGDGYFRAEGLRGVLAEYGFEADVVEGSQLDAGDHVLVVAPRAADGRCFVVPSFVKSPRDVRKWFDDCGDGVLAQRIERVLKVAKGRRSGRTVEFVSKGKVG